ncbi:hypothetical protein [Streptomyces sp. NPDC046371]|uniref:hypothetical protein n=1 Tax=Streptomyces sp. NPDC046371 TaxID=3154916 RepID=UPI00340409AA
MSLGPEVRRGGNLPFGMFAAQWMCDSRYSSNARTLYGILITYADTQDRSTAKGKPYRSALARQLGVSLATLDRTLLELEVGGMVRIEARKDPSNPLQNEANIYHLLDAPLMWQGNGTWVDPLGPDVKAADAAKEVTEARRAEKRAAGLVRKGGVAKGISTKAVKAAREAASDEEGGSSTHAATPGSTGAARVAAPVLPFIQSPVQKTPPDPDAPSGRSPVDGRSPSSTGSRAAGDEGGSAASGKTQRSPSTKKAAAGGKRHSRSELAIVEQVRAFYPPEFGNDLPQLPAISGAILDAMASDGRTAQQLGERILYRWLHHGYAEKFHTGTLMNPVGAAVGMVRPLRRGDRYACADTRCENGRDVETQEECRLCAVRAADWKAAQERKRQVHGRAGPRPLPTQRAAASGPSYRECVEPACRQPIVAREGDPYCAECRADAAAAREAAAAVLASWGEPEVPFTAPAAGVEAWGDSGRAAEERAALAEERRREEAAEDARLRAEFAAQNPGLAAYSQQAPF